MRAHAASGRTRCGGFITLNLRIILSEDRRRLSDYALHFGHAEKSLRLTKEFSPMRWTSLPILFIRPVTPRSQARTGD
ncbi:hypothetical protein IE4771_CH02884 [Rhizobium etli bv. mimosae str. IE4771]|uniref:Uncharacterized protein n=1 Tax=Rhizobium etli bv. mimosae str. IE4771 TaxID=1432050 RepID=A0A060I2M7_RHIET|nr:hypothetical protein IE4771_CH02884 [Rhizobium sp. IE4771]